MAICFQSLLYFELCYSVSVVGVFYMHTVRHSEAVNHFLSHISSVNLKLHRGITLTNNNNRKYIQDAKPHLVLFQNQILTDLNISYMLLEVTMFTHSWRP